MKISYGITVHNESDELNRLLDMLLNEIDEEDEIVICIDGDDEGVKNVSGDTIIEDLHPAHAFLQAFGFAPAAYSRQLEENSVLKGAERGTMKRRSLLLTQYYRAMIDSEPVDKILDKMQKYNEDHPEYPITRDVIQRSMRTRLSKRQKKYHGVTFTPRLDNMYRQYGSEFDKSSSLYM